MFREAIGYPTRPPGGGRTVILGGVLLIIVAAFVSITRVGLPYGVLAAVGVVPWLLVRGYYVRVVRTTIARDDPTPPRLRNVRRLFGDGVKAVGISVAYLLPGIIVLGPLIALQVVGMNLSVILTGGAVPESASIAVTSITGIIAVVALMYVIGALYVLPVAVARFAHSGDPQAAFELRTVISGAVTEDYATAWGVSLILRVFLLPITLLLYVFIIGFFLHFIIAMAVRYCYGQGVGAALGLDSVPAAHERSDPKKWALSSAVRRIDDGSGWQTANLEPTRSPAGGTATRSREPGDESNESGFQFGGSER